GIHVCKDYPIDEIIPFIDWTFFFHAWRLTGSYDGIGEVGTTISQSDWLNRFSSDEGREKAFEALKLWQDAQDMLQKMQREKMTVANAVIGLFPANSVEDDIEVYHPENPFVKLCTFHHIREQQEK